MITEQKIANEIALLLQSKGEQEKILQEKQSELETLLADQVLGSEKRQKIEALRQDIEKQKSEIARLDDTMRGLQQRSEEAKAAAPEVKRLIKVLRNSDLNLLYLLREKLIALQEVIRIETKMNDALLKHNELKAQCIGIDVAGFPEVYQIPLNLLMMDLRTEFIQKFLPLDDSGLPEMITLVEKITREVRIG